MEGELEIGWRTEETSSKRRSRVEGQTYMGSDSMDQTTV